MAHRTVLTDRQRAALFDLPTVEAEMLHHYTLSDDDLEIIRARRRPHNRFGFALQLCALRYPGRLLTPGEVIPLAVTRFLAAQVGLKPDDLAGYATREETRHEHLATLREQYGYRMFSGRGARDLKGWLQDAAEGARSNDDLARRFVEQCRATRTILPGVTIIERLCADALVAAERRIESRIAKRLDDAMRIRLDALLTEDAGGSVTRFVWLRQFEAGQNSADMNRLLDRLEFLQRLGLTETVLAGVPPHRIARLRRQGERYFAGDLRDISGDRRLAILAVCVLEWRSALADAIVETHDRIVGKTWREAKSRRDARAEDAKAALKDTLQSFATLGSALLEAHEDRASLEEAVDNAGGWLSLKGLVATAAQLTEHIFNLTQSLELYDFYKAQIAACDRKLEAAVGTLTARAEDDLAPLPKARIKGKQHNAPSFDVRSALYGVLGTDLTSWLCLAPGNKISGGKLLSSRTRRSSSRAAALLRLAATTIGRSDTALGAFYRRLSSRIGKQKAVTATARKIAVLFYNAVRYGMTYQDQGAAAYDDRHRQRVLSNLQRRAKTLGFALAPIPEGAAVS